MPYSKTRYQKSAKKQRGNYEVVWQPLVPVCSENAQREEAKLISDYLMVSPHKSTSKYNGSCHSTDKWSLVSEVYFCQGLLQRKLSWCAEHLAGGENLTVYLSGNSTPWGGLSFSYTCLMKWSMVIKVTFTEANCEQTLHTTILDSISWKLLNSFFPLENSSIVTNILSLEQLCEVGEGRYCHYHVTRRNQAQRD